MVSINFPLILSLFTITAIRGGRLLLPLYALKLNADPFTVGLIAATFSALPMMLSVSAGQASDRLGTRWPLLFGIAGSTLGILVPFVWGTMPALFIAAVMNGFAFTFYNVSLQNAIGLLSTEKTRVKNYASFSLTNAIGQFIAPLAVGFSIDHLGHAQACLVVAALAIVPIGMLVFAGQGLPRSSAKARKGGGGLRQQLADPSVRRVLGISSLIVTGIELFVFYMPIYGHQLGFSASVIGMILACYAAAAFITRSILPWLMRTYTLKQVLVGAFIISAGSFFVMPLLANPVLLGLTAFIFGLGAGCGQPITMSLSFSNASEGRSGEAMGMRMAVNHGTRVAIPVVFGSIGSAFGMYPVFWITALMLAGGIRLARSDKLAPDRKANDKDPDNEKDKRS
jgi:MFS family permease